MPSRALAPAGKARLRQRGNETLRGFAMPFGPPLSSRSRLWLS
jgi:hypothetical protein